MSAPTPRVQRGGAGASVRGTGRAGATTNSSNPRGGSPRGNARAGTSRGRGRGRGGTTTAAAATTNPGGLLQSLRTGNVRRGTEKGFASTRGRGRGNATKISSAQQANHQGSSQPTFSTSFGGSVAVANQTSELGASVASPSPAGSASYATFMQDMNNKWQSLKQKREAERAKAIRDGFLADPEKKTSLDKAITPVGTCTEMCAPFERAERIVQQMVDKAEKAPDSATGKDMPVEEWMVKRFRRSAAGNDEQLPSDIRTPQTLKKTLDYLFNDVIGGPERLASIHKFVWDRTRAIRNDFSIQQVTKTEDVKVAVECYERIARFHILSLHQLSNPNQLLEGENFDAHQEREQLNNTLLSLMYYYDDNRHAIPFPYEPEFRAYCIIFEIQSQHPDLEDRMQAWPSQVLEDRRVQTAFKLYTAAGNTLFDQGPLRPNAPFSIAQNNSGAFWTLLASNAVSYVMACVAEIYFAHIRFASLDALWRSGKGAPQAQQAKNTEWTLSEVTDVLAFDTDSQTLDFCAAFNLTFGTSATGEQYLNFTALSVSYLDKSSVPSQQVFSHDYVEPKRYKRTFVAVMNGLGVAQAIRDGMVEAGEEDDEENQQSDNSNDEQSMFIPDKPTTSFGGGFPFATPPTSMFGSGLNPQAPSFTSSFGETSTQQPVPTPKFGDPNTVQKSIFGQQSLVPTNASPVTRQTPLFGVPAAEPLASDLGKRDATGEGAGASAISSQPSKPGSITDLGTTSFPDFSFTRQSISTPTSQTKPSAWPGSDLGQISSSTAVEQPSIPVFGTHQPPSRNPIKTSTSSTSTALASTHEVKTPVFTSGKPNNIAQPAFGFTSPPTTNEPPSSQPSQSPTSTPFFSFGTTQPQATPTQTPAGGKAPFSFKSAPLPPVFSAKDSTSASQHSDTSTTASPQAVTPFSFQQQSKQSVTSSADVRPEPTPIQPLPASLQKSDPAAGSVVSPRSATPPQSPPQQPSKPVLSTAERSRLVTKVSHLALCQPGGLLQEYLEYVLPDLLKGVVRQHEEEVKVASILRIKTQVLYRKFGARWKQIFWRNNLNRRATKRRQLFSETMRAQQEKRKRDDQELEDILTAAKEKQRIQAEIKQAQVGTKDETSTTIGHEMESQHVGVKRKEFSNSLNEEPSETTHERKTKQHKRSRTMSSIKHTPPQQIEIQKLSRSGSFRTSIFSGKTSINQPANSKDLSMSQIRAKQDATQTDYFRLLALGVDPQSPLVPLTDKEVKDKQRRDEASRAKVVADTWNRRRIVPLSNTPNPPQQTLPRAVSSVPSAVSVSRSTSVATPDPESADLLQQLREAREAMAKDSDWFREQTALLEREIEQEDKLRSSVSSQHSLPRLSINGLPMANGYEFVPAPEKPGIPLSRTEHRIRTTGAHGLAYKPIGSQSNYTPVAMSKKSAIRYSQTTHDETARNGVGHKKRRRHAGEIDRTYRPVAEDELEDEEVEKDEEEDDYEEEMHTRTNRVPYKTAKVDDILKSKFHVPQKSAPSQRILQTNQFAALQDQQSEADEDEEAAEEYLIEQNDLLESTSNFASGTYDLNSAQAGSEADITDDLYEAEEDEDEQELLEEDYEDEDEDESEGDYDDDDDDDGHELLHPSFRPQHLQGQYGDRFGTPDEDADTPATQLSRASSGPGASADDALVLSD